MIIKHLAGYKSKRLKVTKKIQDPQRGTVFTMQALEMSMDSDSNHFEPDQSGQSLIFWLGLTNTEVLTKKSQNKIVFFLGVIKDS